MGALALVTISTQRLSAMRARAESCRRSLVLNGRPSRPSTTTSEATDRSAHATSAGWPPRLAAHRRLCSFDESEDPGFGGHRPDRVEWVGGGRVDRRPPSRPRSPCGVGDQAASRSAGSWRSTRKAAVSRASRRGSTGAPGTWRMSSTSTPSTSLTSFTIRGEQAFVREFDHQLVDRLARAPFEDVDPDQVAAHRPDPAGNSTERPRPVGQPDPHNIGRHTPTLRGPRERKVSTTAPRRFKRPITAPIGRPVRGRGP